MCKQMWKYNCVHREMLQNMLQIMSLLMGLWCTNQSLFEIFEHRQFSEKINNKFVMTST
jgi:hypothetical protein